MNSKNTLKYRRKQNQSTLKHEHYYGLSWLEYQVWIAIKDKIKPGLGSTNNIISCLGLKENRFPKVKAAADSLVERGYLYCLRTNDKNYLRLVKKEEWINFYDIQGKRRPANIYLSENIIERIAIDIVYYKNKIEGTERVPYWYWDKKRELINSLVFLGRRNHKHKKKGTLSNF